jgi:hypothetical protein
MFYKWAIMVTFSLFVGGCNTIAAEGVYHPTGIPLQVSVNTWGEVNFTVDTGVNIPTPIGAFEANVIIDPARELNSNQNTLTIRLNGQDRVYDLHGVDFNIEFESGYYEKIRIDKHGNNLLLEIRQAVVPVPDVVTQSPEQFLQDYFYDVVNSRNYEYLWSLQTSKFQEVNSKSDYHDYTSFWNSISDLDLSLADCYLNSDESADCHVKFTLYKNGNSYSVDVNYYLIYNDNKQSWIFDIK